MRLGSGLGLAPDRRIRLGSGLGLAPDRRIRLGSGLGVSPDVSSLLQNLVRAGSALLDPGTKEHWEHWEQIQRGEGGVALLLHSFQDYAGTLAQNVRKTYLKPFTIVTDNMSERSRPPRCGSDRQHVC